MCNEHLMAFLIITWSHFFLRILASTLFSEFSKSRRPRGFVSRFNQVCSARSMETCGSTSRDWVQDGPDRDREKCHFQDDTQHDALASHGIVDVYACEKRLFPAIKLTS